MEKLNFRKEEVKEAFEKKQRNRAFMLFTFYKSIFLTKEYSHEVIAKKLSEDLNHPISVHAIHRISSKFIKKRRSDNSEINKQLAMGGDASNSAANNKANEIENTDGKETSGGLVRNTKEPRKIDVSDIMKRFNITNGDEAPSYDPIPDL